MPRLDAYCHIILLKFALVLPLCAFSISFDITYFTPDAKNLIYEGLATASNGTLDLFPSDEFGDHVGRVKYAEYLHLWDSSTSRLTDFNTSFSFIIRREVSSFDLSDCIVFFLAPINYQIPPNSANGYLGLFNSTVNQSQILLVEFDTYPNKEWDPPGQHVGINNGSLISAVNAYWDAEGSSDKTCYSWIDYNATSTNLTVLWSCENDKGNSSLSYTIDLMKVLPEKVVLGFSGTTGTAFQRYSINSWRFSSSLDFKETDGIKSSKRITTILDGSKSRKRIATILGALGGFLLLLIVILVVTHYAIVRRKSKTEGHGIGSTLVDKLVKNDLPIRFCYKNLEKATKGFADGMKLGQGGSGQVYKGILPSDNKIGDKIVAIKRIFTESSSSEKIFINEVKIISRLIHRNLVPFIGWCHEKGKFLLVYEYMPNGSLDSHLFATKRENNLSWEVRNKIVLGLASAIHYLHEEAGQCIIHRDIKPANILLDKDFNAKLCDFGIAMLIDPHLRTLMTRAVGTLGYMAPEYANEGRASKRSDMYSFGIVALEIVCGRRTYRHGDFYMPLVKWVWQLYLAGNILSAVDERLELEFNKEEVECLLMIGLWCTHPNEKERPAAGHVIKVLQFDAPLPKLREDMHNSTLHVGKSSEQLQNDSMISVMSSSLDCCGR